MKSAYLYVRVSTDEQKRKGYSLPEQEECLVRYCRLNNILIKGIYREDYSAKTFKRPEWRLLLAEIKRSRGKKPENILFLKWDRFSRNIENAYNMLGALRDLNVQAMAIDQPIDFSVPESTVTLAIYLSVPEAENRRRALNTSAGLKRAKISGRHLGKAPIGYINKTYLDGRKYIIPKYPEAELIAWCFKELSKGRYAADRVRQMACKKGLRCERSNFYRLIRNPLYCGFFIIKNPDGEPQIIKALHEPLISESLFKEVQVILKSKQRQRGVIPSLNDLFPLRGFLKCPLCMRNLTGSFSKGKKKIYPYYHCQGSSCKARFKAELLHESYENKLKQYKLVPGIRQSFNLIRAEGDYILKREYIFERKKLLKQVYEQETLISSARKLFIKNEIEVDDFRVLKRDYGVAIGQLNAEINLINDKLKCNILLATTINNSDNLFHWYVNQDLADKRLIISMILPDDIDPVSKNLKSIKINEAISKIIIRFVYNENELVESEIFKINHLQHGGINHTNGNKITIERVTKTLKSNGIDADYDQAKTILKFLYVLAKGSKIVTSQV
jgi:DNA invertase Pin-like site-specific DNA recombinase